jgi:hypothetical protein
MGHGITVLTIPQVLNGMDHIFLCEIDALLALHPRLPYVGTPPRVGERQGGPIFRHHKNKKAPLTSLVPLTKNPKASKVPISDTAKLQKATIRKLSS